MIGLLIAVLADRSKFETVAKALTSREWFREPGGHSIDCRDPFSPGVAP